MHPTALLVPLQAIPQELPLRARVVHVDAPGQRGIRRILQYIDATVKVPNAPEPRGNDYAGVEGPHGEQEADVGRATPPPNSPPHGYAAEEGHHQLGSKHVDPEQIAVDQAALDLRQVAGEKSVVVGGHHQD